MKKRHLSALEFLDIEAEVDEDENDEDEGWEEPDPFIHDVEDLESEEDSVPRLLIEDDEARDSRMERAIERIENRFFTRGPSQTFGTNYSRSGDVETLIPQSQDDYPTWKVACWIGEEEFAVVSLLRTVHERHEVRSAFTRGTIRGHIFIECTMNQDLIRLLMKTPGVIRTKHGLKRQILDNDAALGMLRMKNVEHDLAEGRWVRVKKGLYKGDVGLIVAACSWGVSVILIPRLGDSPSQEVSHKRKASLPIPDPHLFDPKQTQLCSVSQEGDIPGTSVLGSLVFEHGLLRKNLDYHSVSPDVEHMTFYAFQTFRLSNHPSVLASSMPRPMEWMFYPNECAIICSSGTKGRVHSVDSRFVELETDRLLAIGQLQDSSTRIEQVRWNDIEKHFQLGDQIRVNTGIHAGETGLVVDIQGSTVTVATKDNNVSNDQMALVQSKQFHVNTISLCNISYLQTSSTMQTDIAYLQAPSTMQTFPVLTRQSEHPWCGINVIISKALHPDKGETGVVKNVSRGPKDSNTLLITMQLTRYDPSTPFRQLTIDYRSVVELYTQLPLDMLNTRVRVSSSSAIPLQSDTQDSSGGKTPLPEPSAYDEPAWNPGDRTYDEPALNPGNILLDHVLNQESLVGAKLVVVADGGRFCGQDIFIQVHRENGNTIFRQFTTRSSYTGVIEPHLIKPKHPPLKNGCNLFVIIKGEHCGKYVRRLYSPHRGQVMVVAVVVNNGEGICDTLTGEELGIPVSSLCVAYETKRQMNLNRELMKRARDMYISTHITD